MASSPHSEVPGTDLLSDAELERYSRQILLPGFDLEGQERLRTARVLVIGAGGLGSPAALYLAGSGVGRLTLCDGDQVELSNLHRQILHRTADLGCNKAVSATRALTALNPEIRIVPLPQRMTAAMLHEMAGAADVILDGSDNFATRYAVNAAAMRAGKPLVSGAVSGYLGQVTVFRAGGPCFACLYPEEGRDGESDCSSQGILAPLAGIIGSIMATETLKLLLGLGEGLHERLLRLDAATMRFRTVRLHRDPACTVCGTVCGAVCGPAHAEDSPCKEKESVV